ncbi:MAG: hypothetical protein M3004_04980 [Bacteroidota bacterium]|nr:hypothetical protein [Bacteroidota bacterium]
MNRIKKIEILKGIKDGTQTINDLIKNTASIPSWIVNDFDNKKDLEKHLIKSHGYKLRVIESEGKYYIIPLETIPIIKANWFINETD